MVLYTWDELYERADGSACGNPKLRAKDNAREILAVIIEKETGICIDDLEIPEEGMNNRLPCGR